MINGTLITLDEWRAEGISRFGENTDLWRFECPSCGNVAAVGDFQKFKDKGAIASSATVECIGRYTGAAGAFNRKLYKPCNYAGYGLFRLCPIYIQQATGEMAIHCFAFALAA